MKKSLIPINNIEYTETTRNVDDMLKRFYFDRLRVVEMMSTNVEHLLNVLWTKSSPVSIDNECLCQMGKTTYYNNIQEQMENNRHPNETLANFYMCSQCKNISRLIKLTPKNINKPFFIEYGNNSGKNIIILQTYLSKYSSRINPHPQNYFNFILNKRYLFNKCNNFLKYPTQSYENIKFISSDQFTNQMLISWYLEDYLNKISLPHICKIYTSFICNNFGYYIYENPDIGRLNNLQKQPHLLLNKPDINHSYTNDSYFCFRNDVTRNIFIQLFCTLHALMKYDFSHGGPSSRSILFSSEPCSYIYNDIHVDSEITLKLSNFTNSAITLANLTSQSPSPPSSQQLYRLYSSSIIGHEIISRKKYSKIISTISQSFINNTVSSNISNNSQSSKNVNFYKLKNPSSHLQESIIYMYMKHLGLPLFQSSFDAYSFIIVLMSNPYFYCSVIDDPSLFDFWKSLWIPSEFQKVNENVKLLHSDPDSTSKFYKILIFLSNYHLRCDLISHAFSHIRSW